MKQSKKKLNKKRIKLLSIFATISIGVVALSLGLGLGLGLNGTKDSIQPTPTPPSPPSPPTPTNNILIEGNSKWDPIVDEEDSITYKAIDTSTGDELTDVTYSVSGVLPNGFGYAPIVGTGQLTIEGKSSEKSTTNITITANSTSQGTATKNLTLTVHTFINVPINENIYRIENNIIQGFSTTFLSNTNSQDIDKAKQYLINNTPGSDSNSEFCMDLRNQRITGTTKAFSSSKSDGSNNNINNILPLFGKLDFSDTQWQWSGDRSATNTFNSCNFSNVRILNLQSANFAVNNDKPTGTSQIHTADDTFSYATFSSLETLNLSGTIFATNNMSQNNKEADTAYCTFNGINFQKLETLNLSGAIFAIANMTSDIVTTAWYMFVSTTFESLETLNLSGAVFATAGMRTSSGNVYTGNLTFASAAFSSLENLNFGNCRFGNDNTGTNTISSSCFNSLRNKNRWHSSNKLKLFSDDPDYWRTNNSSQLNTWFNGPDSWTF